MPSDIPVYKSPFPVYLPTQSPLPGEAVHQEQNKTLLFTPIQIKGVKQHNRIVVSPMCMYSSKDGFFNDYHLVHLGTFALKGAGLIFTEALAVTPEGRISPDDAGIYTDAHIAPISRVADFIHSQGSHIGVQIAHAGRKASTRAPFWPKGPAGVHEDERGWPNEVVGPSSIAYDQEYIVPKELTKKEIKDIHQSFADAARRALAAGIDVIEIHGAHGYLTHEFLSGNSNKRTDEYGGSFKNRIRFALELAQAVRDVWPQDKPLWFRVSATDWVSEDPFAHDPEGWDIHQTVELARELAKIGVDVIDVSSAGNLPFNKKVELVPGYQAVFAAEIKKNVPEIKVASVGLILDGPQAEEILQKNKADVVLVARGFLKNPAWVDNAAKDLGVDIGVLLQHARKESVYKKKSNL